jgi:Ulp1 family protease
LVEIILYISKSSFAINVDALEIEVPFVERQSGGVDCGLFAIAFAYELASGNDHTIQSKRFEQHRMRDQMPREWRRREDPNIFEIDRIVLQLSHA